MPRGQKRSTTASDRAASKRTRRSETADTTRNTVSTSQEAGTQTEQEVPVGDRRQGDSYLPQTATRQETDAESRQQAGGQSSAAVQVTEVQRANDTRTQREENITLRTHPTSGGATATPLTREDIPELIQQITRGLTHPGAPRDITSPGKLITCHYCYSDKV